MNDDNRKAYKALWDIASIHSDMGGLECQICSDDRGPLPWPCPTVQVIVKWWHRR